VARALARNRALKKPRRLFRLLCVVAGVLLAVGYHYVYVPRAAFPSLTGSLSRETLRVGDRERTFAYYAPASLPSHPPLLIAFHGSGQTGASFRARTGYAFDRVADSTGFVLAYPDGFENHWNDCRRAASFSARALRVDDDIEHLQHAVTHFGERTGRLPASMAELSSAEGLHGTPVDPDGHPYKLTPQGRIELRTPDDFPFASRGLPPGYKPAPKLHALP